MSNAILNLSPNQIALSEQTINNETVQAVNARELHSFLEVGKMFTHWINDRINQYNFVKNQDYIVSAKIGKNSKGGRPSKEYYITIDMAKELSMVERNAKGQQARRYFIECEKRLKEQTPKNLPQALRAYADEVEKRMLAEQQTQLAIETKAWIGSKREATALATASVATRKVNKLERQLDQSKEYATVKRMQLLYHGQKFNWRDLKSTSNEMGLAPIDVFDNNYGTVKAYHKDVWLETYALEIQG